MTEEQTRVLVEVFGDAILRELNKEKGNAPEQTRMRSKDRGRRTSTNE